MLVLVGGVEMRGKQRAEVVSLPLVRQVSHCLRSSPKACRSIKDSRSVKFCRVKCSKRSTDSNCFSRVSVRRAPPRRVTS